MVAARLVKTWNGGDVVGLVGDLGSGKTTFVQGVAKALGIKRLVKSPTFLRMQVYRLRPPPRRGRQAQAIRVKYFVHVDAYRIKRPEELLELGLEDYLGRKDTLIVIEWAEKVKKILPRTTKWLRLGYGKSEGSRRLIIF